MARINNLSNFLTDVATAIKNKKGSETPIPAANFDTEITNLPSQGVYQHKTATIAENGTITILPDTGYDAIDQLDITVNIPLQQKTYTFTQNTTTTITPEQGYAGFSQVGLEINVPSQQPNLQTKSIVENGTYTPDEGYDGFSQVNVNVSYNCYYFNTIADAQAFTGYNVEDYAIILDRQASIFSKAYNDYSKLGYVDSFTLPRQVNINYSYYTSSFFSSVGFEVQADSNTIIVKRGSKNRNGVYSFYFEVTYTSNDGLTYTFSDVHVYYQNKYDYTYTDLGYKPLGNFFLSSSARSIN